jgi:hypothetical protein
MSTPNSVFKPASKLELVTGTVKAALGSPVLPVELEISAAQDFPLALTEYYRWLPIKAPNAYTIRDAREMTVAHAEAIANYEPDEDLAENFFYVGVLHCAIRAQIGQNAFNQNLLGLNVGVPIADPMENLQMATMIDISTGDVYYEEDEARALTRFIFGGSGNFSVIFGLGHWDVNLIPWRHMKAFSDLVAVQYYSRLIAVRKTGVFGSADFKMDLSFLEAALAEAKQRSKEYFEAATYMAITIG